MTLIEYYWRISKCHCLYVTKEMQVQESTWHSELMNQIIVRIITYLRSISYIRFLCIICKFNQLYTIYYTGSTRLEYLPEDMKKGILNLPERTLSLKDCKVDPSKGSDPHTSTYRTTPKLWKYFINMQK